MAIRVRRAKPIIPGAHFHVKIKAAAKAHGLTHGQLLVRGKFSVSTQQAIGSWLRGERTMCVDDARELSKTANLPLHFAESAFHELDDLHRSCGEIIDLLRNEIRIAIQEEYFDVEKTFDLARVIKRGSGRDIILIKFRKYLEFTYGVSKKNEFESLLPYIDLGINIIDYPDLKNENQEILYILVDKYLHYISYFSPNQNILKGKNLNYINTFESIAIKFGSESDRFLNYLIRKADMLKIEGSLESRKTALMHLMHVFEVVNKNHADRALGYPLYRTALSLAAQLDPTNFKIWYDRAQTAIMDSAYFHPFEIITIMEGVADACANAYAGNEISARTQIGDYALDALADMKTVIQDNQESKFHIVNHEYLWRANFLPLSLAEAGLSDASTLKTDDNLADLANRQLNGAIEMGNERLIGRARKHVIA